MILKKIADIIWGDWLILILFCIGVYFTYILKGIQFFKFSYILEKFFKTPKNKQEITPVQALFTALGSCIGNGNIVGVVTAIMFGGPGALFWMWIAAFIGMAIKYSEIFLGIKYRELNSENEYEGGPMYYISKGLNMKYLAILYSSLLLLQNSGGTLIQGNVIKDIFNEFLNLNSFWTAIILFSFISLVICGGLKRLVKTMNKLVPLMTFSYFIMGFIIIFTNFSATIENFKLIFNSAFEGASLLGGTIGFSVKESIRFGVSRGIYSNEAGEGTASIFYSKVTDTSCKDIGLYGILEVFIDTILVCTLSGIIALLSIDYTHNTSPTYIMIRSFESVHPYFKYFLGCAMILFGVTSILGQWLLGKTSFKYITNMLSKNKNYDNIYNILFLIFLLVSPFFSFKTVWYIQDIALGLLILPNIYALIKLRKDIKYRNFEL